MSPTL